MQLKRNRTIAFIVALIAIILIISVVFSVQNLPKTSPTPTPSSTPQSSPSPTENSPTPTIKVTPTSSPNPTSASQPPTPVPYLFPGEVTQYQNQNLTPISVYIGYLIAHPDVAIAGTQTVNKETYRLAITGLVNNPIDYTYDEVVNNFNSTLDVATLPCVEGWSVTLLWQGVPIKDLLALAGVSPNATSLIFLAADGYSTSLPLSYVTENNITVAYKINNVTLTAQTGWPFFLVAKNQYGYKWIEWLTEINVSNDSSYLGYWESRGYPNNATVPDPKNLAQPLNSLPITISVVTISIVCTSVATALVVSRFKQKEIYKVRSQALD